jgi:hypothetical protein
LVSPFIPFSFDCLPSKPKGRLSREPTHTKKPLKQFGAKNGLDPFAEPWLLRRTPLPVQAKEMVRKPHQYFRPADLGYNQTRIGHRLIIEIKASKKPSSCQE